MNETTSPRRAGDLDAQAAGTALLVHDRKSANVHVLNVTAAKVFALCDGAHTVDAIVDAVAANSTLNRRRSHPTSTPSSPTFGNSD
ncbi:MAG: PqqD family protein [Candidatus Velthaea sp.]